MNPKAIPVISVIASVALVSSVVPDVTRADSSSAATTTTPSRGDTIEKGDRLILQSDANIFYASPDDVGTVAKAYCAPSRSKLVIESSPTTTTTTQAQPANAGAVPTVSSSTTKSTTTVKTTAASAGDTTTTTSKTVSTAVFQPTGGFKLFSKNAEQTKCVDPASTTPITKVVKSGPTYYLDTNDLSQYNFDRFGFTYGVVVVPNKVIISTREFVSSSSVLPYVGWEQWGPSWAGAVVLAAGVGTTPSTNTTATGATGSPPSNTNSGTKATFSVATGIVGTIGGVFKVGLLLGVDTAGSNIGYKYQGKPWIAVSLGAGAQ
jgi:hypothetical protein